MRYQIEQPDTADGVPVSVTVNKHKAIEDDQLYDIALQEIGHPEAVFRCWAHEDIAKAISQHLFKTPIRLSGSAKWIRNIDGSWIRKKFFISSFEILDDMPIKDIIDRIRDTNKKDGFDLNTSLDLLKIIRG